MIRNRTYNLYTKSIGGACNTFATGTSPLDALLNIKWDDVRLFHRIKVKNLLGGKKYQIDYYGYQNGAIQYISTDNKTSTLSGKLKLRYPELRVEENWQHRPVIWFVARRKGYNGIMPSNKEDSIAGTAIIYQIDSTNSVLNREKEIELKELQVYPNPFNHQLAIESAYEDKVIIQAISGRRLIKKPIKIGKTIIPTYGLAKGMYLIHFITQNETFKMVKK